MPPNAVELSALRAITFRISSTAPSQLAQQIPAIVASLPSCKPLLSTVQTSGSKAASEASVAVHKYRTLISTLLQDRAIQGRWAAIALVKSTIEAGGWETLQKSLPWVRGLLGILTKPDPPSSKKLCIITLARIFILTREYPTLIREITTPSLPTFIQSCLQIAASNASPSLLQVVLENFSQLLPRHPTVFRSYLKQIQQLLSQILAPTPSNKLSREQSQGSRLQVSSGVSTVARGLYTQLSCCAPKGVSTEDWESSFENTILKVHRVANKVFRAVVEDWQPTSGAPPTLNGQTLDDEVQDLQVDTIGLPPWSGIFAGGERLICLLRLVKEFIGSPTTGAINFRIGLVMDLLTRMFSLTVPPFSSANDFQNTVRLNNQISKEERENLWEILPQVHVAAIEVLMAVTGRCDEMSAPLVSILLDQIAWVFNSEKNIVQVRAASYLVIGGLLKVSGTTLPKSSIDSLGDVIRFCCGDLLPQAQLNSPTKAVSLQSKTNGNSHNQSSTNADTFLNISTTLKVPMAEFSGLDEAAHDLLPILLTNIPAQYISDSLRTRMDRTAVLTQHKDAMMASVLNPPPSKKFGKSAASILPFIARSFADSKDVDGLLRPRMPVIRTGPRGLESDEEVDEEAMEEAEQDHFVGEELDTLLESATHTDKVEEDPVMIDATTNVSVNVASEPAFLSTVVEGNKKADNTPELTQTFGSSSKRLQTEDNPMSPSKRARVEGKEELTPLSVPDIIPTAVSVPTQLGEASEPTVMPAIVSTQSIAATQPFTSAPEDSDDNDDFGTLVLGQDTDEDSDS
ncbi:hypothetical protein K469DRAFT_397371 [Zopfia rhizophila CBS 207.26]|uniref:Pre-rRNA-processing protein RIX1 n=1 Tax=Zopfia rhizophila CBS 207.26 TaxID=1314779 RepID=A0A6A6DFM2_9PEZI|nr:hypothetical protein K469DRAFT_397371 [Zopfia rhizophila CBS 207.26]